VSFPTASFYPAPEKNTWPSLFNDSSASKL
jgi:hypothetical protein